MNPRLLLLILSLLTLSLPRLHGAAFDAFLEIDGIAGETEDREFKGTIHIESFSWGCSNAPSRSGGTGKVSFSDIRFSTVSTKASPKLMEHCATGKVFKVGTLHLRIRRDESTPPTYHRYELENVLISSYSVSGAGSAGDSVPTDSFSLNFTKVTFSHRAPDGTVTTGSAELTSTLTPSR
jgi:type VI secretion system secreted protein Hcp